MVFKLRVNEDKQQTGEIFIHTQVIQMNMNKYYEHIVLNVWSNET